jgi:protein-ribulosamine 3-kinase
MNWEAINQQISLATGRPFSAEQVSAQGGGCINQAYRISDGDQAFFIKLNEARLIDMFEAEYEGLEELRRPEAITVPRPICTGIQGNQSYIVLEALELRGSCDASLLGEQLARLHLTHADRFGWHRNNTIGSTPQHNDWTPDWIDFFRQHRLAFQLRLARDQGIGSSVYDRGMELSAVLGDFFTDYQPRASLLHGDLWSGNVSGDSSGIPVIFDPAVYFGDPETDLAMTELFGGFGSRFFDAYDGIRPIDPGYKIRKTLYNLYHILNHFNLFGGGYGQQAAGMINRLLAAR